MQQYWLGPYYLALPEVLEGLDIVERASEIPLTLEEKSGIKEQVVLSGKPFNFTGFPTLPAPNNSDNLLYLKNKKENYWLEYNSDSDFLYLQFNRVAQDKSHPLDVFSKGITAFTKGRKIKNLVLDLRHNNGGNGSIIPPLTRSLIHFS
ncbi:S41 family peptidase [Microbulbifer sp. A4B17]|uniref:S41 family peptidase n=1 Tax=Microbulbifer sp. A4B17 TaxID=359370 RepID=UPI0013002BB7|nr:S41 family peptidase [Microbulbifer sp. A4B17]